MALNVLLLTSLKLNLFSSGLFYHFLSAGGPSKAKVEATVRRARKPQLCKEVIRLIALSFQVSLWLYLLLLRKRLLVGPKYLRWLHCLLVLLHIVIVIDWRRIVGMTLSFSLLLS